MNFIKKIFMRSICFVIFLFSGNLLIANEIKNNIYDKKEVQTEVLVQSEKKNKNIELKKEYSDISQKNNDIIDIYSVPKEVSSEWKSDVSEKFYKDIAIIKQVVLDGEKDSQARNKFLKSFRDQQDWFDQAISSTQNIGDLSYKEIEEKKFFVGRIANAQRRCDKLIANFTKKLNLSSIIKKKIRLNVLADINTYVLEEMRRGLKPNKNSYLSDEVISKLVNEDLKDIKKTTLVGNSINPIVLNGVNLGMGQLMTKDDYRNFSTQLRKNISGELKEVFSTIENRIEEQSKKNKEEMNKNYQQLLNTLDSKLSSTEARLQMYIDKKMDEFTKKIDFFTKKENESRGIIDLEVVENKMKNYFDEKFKNIQAKMRIPKKDKGQIKSIFNISKKNIDKKIYDEVGRQLSALKEDRIKKFEKLSRKKKKAERRKLLRTLLEKELDKNFH
ncbi:hypothetical protein GF385_04015 [Candidatus Dependentiae bacterium]|nr:hypothetical protein [Candidatus Dependentiae bacterium]